eukprot:SAG22_NODE_111_length_19607_cov_12.696637_13_plen_47_part_00
MDGITCTHVAMRAQGQVFLVHLSSRSVWTPRADVGNSYPAHKAFLN